MKIINSLPLINSLKSSLMAAAIIFSMLLLSACEGGSSSSSSNDEPDTGSLLIPVEGEAELLSNVKSGMNQTASVNRERFDGDVLFLDESAPIATDTSSDSSFTTTYTLEASIDEHDFVKYDGDSNHLFIAPSRGMDCCFIVDDIQLAVEDEIALIPPSSEDRSIRIVATDPDTAGAEEVGSIELDDNLTVEGLYTNNSQLVSISSSGWWGSYGDGFARVSNWQGQTTALNVYDITDVSAPTTQLEIELQGGFVDSRKKGDMVYLIARHTPNIDGFVYYPSAEQAVENERLLSELAIEDVLPKVTINGVEGSLLAANDCDIANPEHSLSPAAIAYPTMTLMIAINIAEQSITHTGCYFERADGIYVSESAIYLTQVESSVTGSRTFVHRYALSENLDYLGSGVADGSLYLHGNKDFRINEHEGYLRLVTTEFTNDSSDRVDHKLSILALNPDSLTLDLVATLPNEQHPEAIGKPNEDLYGVRFFGDKLYLVTFERIDPLYVLDLSNPADPLIAGELTVTGFSDFLHPVNNELLMGLGQDEDGLVKLELFNVAGVPYSLGSMSLGKSEGAQSSYSEARYNRHAFTYQVFSESTDRFLVPVDLSFADEESGYRQEDRLYMFELNDKNLPQMASFQSIGQIVVEGEGWQASRHRSVIHEDAVYYVNGTSVWSALWTVPNEQNGPL